MIESKGIENEEEEERGGEGEEEEEEEQSGWREARGREEQVNFSHQSDIILH